MRPSRPFRNGFDRGNNFLFPPAFRMRDAPYNSNWQDLQFMRGQHRIPQLFETQAFPIHIQNQLRPIYRQNSINPLMNQNRPIQRGKRIINSKEDEGQRKKTKLEDPNKDSFVVPCAKGTEKITVSIWEYFLRSQMTDSDLKKKLLLQKTLQSIIKEAFPDCRLFIVGSSMTGFATKTSDVDMCLMLSDKDIHQKREAPIILTALLKAIRHCPFIHHPLVIRAKVPILKFKDLISGFECDININNKIGIRNTHLLRYYAHLDWRVRPLMLFIKHWARYHDINDASKQTISSYSLSLMLIHYLQAGVKTPILPCLQSLKPRLFSVKNDVLALSLEREKIDFVSSNKATLGELFLGFLDYYSNVFAYDRDIISVQKGKRIGHYDVDHTKSDWKFLCIEEPFDETNTARSVYDHFVFLRILRVFSRSFEMLRQHRTSESILSCPF